MTEYIFNPIKNKTPQGPVKAGGEVTYTVKVARQSNCDSIFLMLIDDSDNSTKKIKMPLHSRDENYNIFQATITYEKTGLFWYYFKCTYQTHIWYLCKTKTFDAKPMTNVNESFAQVVFEKNLTHNKQFSSGIIYHIFVDRFRKSGEVTEKKGMKLRKDWGGSITRNTNDFLIINKEYFGGNLYGIIEKLPYIKSLGATTIMLSPIFESSSYHKYDTADLETVDSMFGGDSALQALVNEAKKIDIDILLDGVFNHVGSDSIYFNKFGTYNEVGAYQSQKSKYYDWFIFNKFPDDYSSWWGFDTLPQFNESNPSLQKYIAGAGGIIDKHMKTGIIGFRLDVADELTDDYLNKICARIRQNKKDAMIMGEVWEDAAIKLAYGRRRAYFNGLQLNSVMNYPLKNAIIDFVLNKDAEGLASVFYMLKDHYPRPVQSSLMNFLGSHDTKRILTVLQEKNQDRSFDMLKTATAILYCSPGVPAIFYGDEAGVTGGDAPFSRVCFPWGKENKIILDWYRKLGELRAKEILISGDCNILFAQNGVFIMERTHANSRLILAANCSNENFKLNLETEMTVFESNKRIKDSIILKPYDLAVLISCP